jgi:anti-sigma-K factor RskA
MGTLNEDFKQLCVDYVSRGMTGDEAREFEDYLKTASPSEIAYFRNVAASFSMLAFDADGESPSAEIKHRLFKDLGLEFVEAKTNISPLESAKPDKPASSQMWKLYAAAAMVFLALTVVLSIMLTREIRVNEVQQARIELLSNELDAHRELFALLQRQGVILVGLDGLEVNPGGFANVVWDPELKEAFMHVANLPEAPTDKDYQLWMIVDSAPVSAGLFQASSSSSNLFYRISDVQIPDASPVQAFAVTIEPKGGVPAPTGDMYLLGVVGSGE